MTALPAGFFERPFAHRALHGPGRPENALSAVRAAVSAGYAIEIDLQPSADGIAMVFHDDTLDRMTKETGPVAGRDAETLGSIALLGGDGEGIPTLTQVLEAVAGQVPLLLELKDQDGALGPEIGDLERATAAALEGYAGPVAVMSFNPYSVARMAELRPDLPRGLTTSSFSSAYWPRLPEERRAAHREMRMLQDVQASFISHHAQDLRAVPVARARALGLPVACWTIRSPEEERAALEVADCVTFEGYLP